jgi:hypothetical protein
VTEEGPATRTESPEQLVIVLVPPLISQLSYHESRKGAPLTEAEVNEIRDNSPAIALPKAEAAALERGRGFRDIDYDRAWDEWVRTRAEIRELPQS